MGEDAGDAARLGQGWTEEAENEDRCDRKQHKQRPRGEDEHGTCT